MFNALLLENSTGFKAGVTQLDESQLPPGDVTVAVAWSTLNFKDGLAITNKARWCVSGRWWPA